MYFFFFVYSKRFGFFPSNIVHLYIILAHQSFLVRLFIDGNPRRIPRERFRSDNCTRHIIILRVYNRSTVLYRKRRKNARPSNLDIIFIAEWLSASLRCVTGGAKLQSASIANRIRGNTCIVRCTDAQFSRAHFAYHTENLRPIWFRRIESYKWFFVFCRSSRRKVQYH